MLTAHPAWAGTFEAWDAVMDGTDVVPATCRCYPSEGESAELSPEGLRGS